MTPGERDEITQRWGKATPGPWGCYNGWGPVEGSPYHAVARIGQTGGGTWTVAQPANPGSDILATRDDFEAIAHAPTDIATLLLALAEAEARAADARRAALQERSDANRYLDCMVTLQRDVAAAEAARDNATRCNDLLIQASYEVALAARRDALEEAAKVAEEYADYTGAGYCDQTSVYWNAAQAHEYGRGASYAKHAIAARLRALSPRPAG